MKVEPTSYFVSALKRMHKRYPRVAFEVDAVFTSLEAGEVLGDRVKGVSHPTYKVRMPNRDAKRGKSGGFRLIYYMELPVAKFLLTLYSKTDQSNITVAEIQKLIEDHFRGE